MREPTANPSDEFLKHYRKSSFASIDGWRDDDHIAAFACFRVSARKLLEQSYKQGNFGPLIPELSKIASDSLDAPYGERMDNSVARELFENHFVPYRHLGSESERFSGFVTGYYEPEIDASLTRTASHSVPLYARPADLVEINSEIRPDDWDETYRYARKREDGYEPYFDRAQIEQGALSGRGLEIAWIENPVDAFFIHIQGSARLRFAGGKSRRLSYSAKNGHPYTSIGSILVRDGLMAKEQVTMDTLRSWMKKNPAAATKLMRQNRSYIFFSLQDDTDPSLGPVGAASVPLTPGRSLAVDHTLFTYGMPVWLKTRNPLPGQASPYQRLMIAQDTGSAIRGPARGDIFVGSGDEAGMVAGSIRHDCEFIVLLPVMNRETATQ
ncbi:MAG: MltA domain-containing protein [Pseudomonadota bacterium]